jgi:hypothetical protein
MLTEQKKFITVEQPPSSLKRLILFFAGRKNYLVITLLHKKTASKFGFFSFNEERILVQSKKTKVSIQN